MAKGSEKFSWLRFPGAPRRCWECGKEPLKIDDVGEYRNRYPGQRIEFLCTDCQRKRVAALVARTRSQGECSPMCP